MGRKSTNKIRQNNPRKTELWAQILLPKLQTVPLATLTMDDLANMIGRSKSTIYQYFKTKEALIAYTIETRLQTFYPILDIIAQPPQNPKNELQEFLEKISHGVRDLSPTLFGELQQYYPEAWEKIKQFLHHLLETIKVYYTRGIDAQFFRKVSPELLLSIDEFFVFHYLTQKQVNALKIHSLESLINDYLILRFDGLLISAEQLEQQP